MEEWWSLSWLDDASCLQMKSEAWIFTHRKPAKSVRCPLERPPVELVWPWTCPDRQCKWQNLSRFNVKSYRGRPELNEDGSHPGLDCSLGFLLWLVIISGAPTSLRGAKTQLWSSALNTNALVLHKHSYHTAVNTPPLHRSTIRCPHALQQEHPVVHTQNPTTTNNTSRAWSICS